MRWSRREAWWLMKMSSSILECRVRKFFKGCPLRTRDLCPLGGICTYDRSPLTGKEMAAIAVTQRVLSRNA